VIWAISSSNLAGVTAGRYLSRIWARPLVAELQDPPLYPGSDPSTSEIQRSFRRCLRASAAIVTTTAAYANHLRDEYALPADRVVPIYLSYRGGLTVPGASTRPDDLVLLHAGSLTTSRGQNARTLLEALALVFAKDPSCRGRIRLRLVGGGTTAPLKRLAERMNLSEALEFLDEVPYDQFKKELDAADVLLVIKYVEEQYEMQIPGKLFEYLGTGKPILGIMRGSAEAAEILKRSRVGIVPEYGNPESLGRSILELWSQRGRLHEIYRADADYVDRFSSESMAQRVHELLSGVVARGGLAGETRPTPSSSVD
jgi:glycosyltransferase involved in cell wall biosynthesis